MNTTIELMRDFKGDLERQKKIVASYIDAELMEKSDKASMKLVERLTGHLNHLNAMISLTEHDIKSAKRYLEEDGE
jgi:hypothetical protein